MGHTQNTGVSEINGALSGILSENQDEVPPSIAPVSFSLYSLQVLPERLENRLERPEK